MKKKVDSRVRTLIENNVKTRHRSMFVLVGDKGRDQVRRSMPSYTARAAHRTGGMRRTTYAHCPHSPPPSRASCGVVCPAAAGLRMVMRAALSHGAAQRDAVRGRIVVSAAACGAPSTESTESRPSAGGEPALHAVQGGREGAAVCAVVLQERASLQQVRTSVSAMLSDPQLQHSAHDVWGGWVGGGRRRSFRGVRGSQLQIQ